VAYIDYLI